MLTIASNPASGSATPMRASVRGDSAERSGMAVRARAARTPRRRSQARDFIGSEEAAMPASRRTTPTVSSGEKP